MKIDLKPWLIAAAVVLSLLFMFGDSLQLALRDHGFTATADAVQGVTDWMHGETRDTTDKLHKRVEKQRQEAEERVRKMLPH